MKEGNWIITTYFRIVIFVKVKQFRISYTFSFDFMSTVWWYRPVALAMCGRLWRSNVMFKKIKICSVTIAEYSKA